MKRYGWPLLLLFSSLVVAAAVLAVIGGGPPSRTMTSPALADPEGRAATLDALQGRLHLLGLLSPRCESRCDSLVDRFAQLRDDLSDGVELVLLAGSADRRAAVESSRILYGREAELRELFGTSLGFSPEELEALDRGEIDLLAAFVDPAEKVRGRYAVLRDGDAAIWDRMTAEIGFRLSLAWRPLLHAWLNALSALLLTAGFVFIRRKRVLPHLVCMLLTTLVSLIFLASYIHYHHHVGSMPFRGEGWVRTVYFTVLLTHTVLAAVVPPLAATLLLLAARRRFDAHRRIARWTLPMWLYVSTTGVVIYLMLYVWFAAP